MTRSGWTLWSALAHLWRSLKPHRKRQFAGVLLLMLVGMAAELVTIGAVLPFLIVIADPDRASSLPIIKDLANLIGVVRPFEFLLLSAAILAVAAILGAIARVLVTWSNLKFVMDMSQDIGQQIFGRMIRQPYRHYLSRNTSEMLSGMEKVQAVIWGTLLPGMQAVIAATTAIAIMALLVVVDPVAAPLAGIVMVLAYLCVSFLVRKRLASNSSRLAKFSILRVQTIQEGLGGIRDILIDQSQPVFESKFRSYDTRYRRAQAVNTLINLAPRFVIESTGIVLIAALAIYMSGRTGGIVAALPVLGALALGAQRLLPMLQQSYQGWSSLNGNRQVLFDVIDLMNLPVVPKPPPGDARIRMPFRQSVRLEQVGFRYGNREFALRGVTLEIRKGARIGFVGETGSGKSTLIDIIMGLLEPSEGTISVDGVALSEDLRSQWQKNIAHVPQSIFLSDASIAANIAFGETEEAIDYKRVHEAARLAQIEEWIVSLESGYETPVGERGLRLSGGQRQRIGIARAIYKQAPVLIFDEATSALDSVTEGKIIEGLAQSGHDITLLMIAHRTTTLAECDTIFRLDNGRIIDQGSYADVVIGSR